MFEHPMRPRLAPKKKNYVGLIVTEILGLGCLTFLLLVFLGFIEIRCGH